MSAGSPVSTTGGIKIYVGELPAYVTESQLRDLFSPYGEITSIHLITNKETGTFKGSAFINFARSSSGYSAIRSLNNTTPFPDVYFSSSSSFFHSLFSPPFRFKSGLQTLRSTCIVIVFLSEICLHRLMTRRSQPCVHRTGR